MHDDDARYVANTVYNTTSVIKYLGGGGLASCTLSPTLLRSLVRDSLQRGMRVEFWARGPSGWKISRQASPGNLQDVEDLLFAHHEENSHASVLVAVRLGSSSGSGDANRTVGVAFIDPSRVLHMGEFVDNELFTNLESLLIQVLASECLIPADEGGRDLDRKKVRSVLERCNVAVTERKNSEFNARETEDDLARLIRSEHTRVNALPQMNLKTALGSAAAIIAYLGLMADTANYSQYSLAQYDLSQYMRLDAAAVRALNIMPGPTDNRTMSLYGVLNHTKTAVGARMLSQWLKQPLLDLEEIHKRHSLVQVLLDQVHVRQSLQEDHLRNIPDLYRLSKRLQKGVASLEDVVRVYQVVLRLPSFIHTLQDDEGGDEEARALIRAMYLNSLEQSYERLAKLQAMVETTIDLDALEHHEYIIKPAFDEDLQNLRVRLEQLRADINDEHEMTGEELNQDTEKKLKLEQHSTYGWCMRLTRNEASVIRGKKQYVELSTQKAGVYFTTAKLTRLGREFQDVSASYNRHQSSLVKEVVAIAASYSPVLEELAHTLGHLDVITSFAHASAHAPKTYVRPRMHPLGEGDIVLHEARHPCMELQDDVVFIANDVALRRDTSEFLLITGPNMGGKSTYIRQIGVIALMAQAGCFVPCDDADMCIVDSVLARVGAGDSQLKGISTFMAEMLETATILKTATRNSLLIVDELGRGTSTTDGFGLAWAISEHIVTRLHSFALFATHFHELTALAQQHKQVHNLHVVAHVEGDDGGRIDQRAITLLYRVEDGVCDRSFGIHVAEMAEFPEQVLRMAKRKAAQLEDFGDASDGASAAQFDREQQHQGIAVMKELLSQWHRECANEPTLSADERARKFRALLQGPGYNSRVFDDPYIASVLAES